MGNPLLELQRHGQSIWYDYIRRGLLTSGELQRLIDDDGLRGVTSNPAIFEKAIAGSTDYDEAVRTMQAGGDADALTIYERLAIEDIRHAADLLAPVYTATAARDGYVSLEVSPYLADDTERTIAEARRLWAAVERPNVMIKVPGTAAGLPAIRRLIGEGLNVNVTLLFSQEVYEAVADAYLGGLEALATAGGDLARTASVASFFVSRIDSLIDARVEERLAAASAGEREMLRSLLGKVAIANAKLAYVRYAHVYATPRWRALAARGARPQRLLWASTGAKNPRYRDTLYVEELVGPDTVNTVPAATLAAFRDHGRARQSLTEDLEDAHETMARLAEAGIAMSEVTAQLVTEGVALFADAFDKLLGAVEKKRRALLGVRLDRQSYNVGPHASAVQTTLEQWRRTGKVRRLWEGDATLWTGADEGRWLGWLHIADDQRAHAEHLVRLAAEVQAAGFRHALLLGMGGSSLCPEVLRQTFGRRDGFPELHVLDSTVPEQVRAAERAVDLATTLCIVSSKSGSTTEPNVFKQYFLERVRRAVGAERAGTHFVAITDPGSSLEHTAEGDGFRHVFPGVPSIGGRYSALSNFGMVPAAIMGIDVRTFLEEAERMVHSCASCVPPEDNPGVVLGAVLGTLARAGRDKLTLVASPRIAALGAWLEQLVAESTGKAGTGLVPVDGEVVGPPAVYGSDRLFVYVRLTTAPAPEQDRAIDALEAAGHPVVRIGVENVTDLGEEFFRWEMATAVAGSILGINAFNQPDVEASKVATRTLTAAYEKSGTLPSDPPLATDGGIAIFTDARNTAALGLAGPPTLASCLRAHLGRLGAGDYFAINAYVAMTPAHHERLQAIRHLVRDRRRVATTLGYGPRFLHSTGQLHKGGPNSGVFLQLTADDAEDLSIPGQRLTFGVLKQAQALGDLQVLLERGRRVVRLHLGADVGADLARLERAVDAATA
jgi:transaldolase/glucose-6-phosphate isomerase